MTFEEQFPSLKDWTNLPMVLEVNKAIFYPCTVLKEHCLDKQRVKEAMNKSAFIEHLTVKQQQELFDILEGK